MSLRLRLIVAFFLLSVVPLGAVTFYTYTSNARALREAAGHESESLAGDLTQRMQLVTAQLSDRVEHLMAMQRAGDHTAAPTAGAVPLRHRAIAAPGARRAAQRAGVPAGPCRPLRLPPKRRGCRGRRRSARRSVDAPEQHRGPRHARSGRRPARRRAATATAAAARRWRGPDRGDRPRGTPPVPPPAAAGTRCRLQGRTAAPVPGVAAPAAPTPPAPADAGRGPATDRPSGRRRDDGRRRRRSAVRSLVPRRSARHPGRCGRARIRHRAATHPVHRRRRSRSHHIRHDADPPRDDSAARRLARRLAEALARRASARDRRGQPADARHRPGHPDECGGGSEEGRPRRSRRRTRRRARRRSPPAARRRPRAEPRRRRHRHAAARTGACRPRRGVGGGRMRRRRASTDRRPPGAARRSPAAGWTSRSSGTARSSARPTPKSTCRTCSPPSSRRRGASAARCRSRSRRTASSTRRPTDDRDEDRVDRRRRDSARHAAGNDRAARVDRRDDGRSDRLRAQVRHRAAGRRVARTNCAAAGVRNAGARPRLHRPRADRHRAAVVAADARTSRA